MECMNNFLSPSSVEMFVQSGSIQQLVKASGSLSHGYFDVSLKRIKDKFKK